LITSLDNLVDKPVRFTSPGSFYFTPYSPNATTTAAAMPREWVRLADQQSGWEWLLAYEYLYNLAFSCFAIPIESIFH
jgi:hypothetical protein